MIRRSFSFRCRSFIRSGYNISEMTVLPRLLSTKGPAVTFVNDSRYGSGLNARFCTTSTHSSFTPTSPYFAYGEADFVEIRRNITYKQFFVDNATHARGPGSTLARQFDVLKLDFTIDVTRGASSFRKSLNGHVNDRCELLAQQNGLQVLFKRLFYFFGN